jgi:hypothetical protein
MIPALLVVQWEYSINPGLAVDVTGADSRLNQDTDSRLNQDNYLDVVDDIAGVNPPIIMVDELDDGVVQLDLDSNMSW